MSDIQDKEIQGHSYDGITEYDNPLPTWWLVTFFGTIIFAFIYYIHYEISGGPTLKDELRISMQEIEKLRPAETAAESDDELLQFGKDPKIVNLGMATFNSKCVACHGNELQGIVGPNLTDKYWINGKGTPKEIATVIRKGVVEKGMPSWEALLSKEEIVGLVAYVNSKQGSNPPNAKAPQGNLAN